MQGNRRYSETDGVVTKSKFKRAMRRSDGVGCEVRRTFVRNLPPVSSVYPLTDRSFWPCMPDAKGYKPTLGICNTYCFSSVTMVARTGLIVTLPGIVKV